MEPSISNRTRNGEGFNEKVGNSLISRNRYSDDEISVCVSVQAVSGSTQTDDFDSVDTRSVFEEMSVVRNGLCAERCSNKTGELLINLIRMLSIGRKSGESSNSDEYFGSGNSSDRLVSTQTEESPISIQGFELCCNIIQELALETPIKYSARNEVFESLFSGVCELLDRHSILFNGMVRRFDVIDYKTFTFVANELFEARSETSGFRITWGRVVSLFAFAVRLAQMYKESQDKDRISAVAHYLSTYVTRHLLDFVESEGGWKAIVEHFPPPDTEDKQIKRTMVWWGICVGLLATMYVFRSNFA